MPRRWTNADQYKGADPKALDKLASQLRGERAPSRPPAPRPERVTFEDARALLAAHLGG